MPIGYVSWPFRFLNSVTTFYKPFRYKKTAGGLGPAAAE